MWYIGQSLIAIDHTGVKIKWQPSVAIDLDGYNVYMKEGDDATFIKMTPKPILESEWDSPPLRRDIPYYFYITAIDRSDNESDPSVVQTFIRSDADIDPNVILVPSPTTITLASGDGTTTTLSPSSNLMTQFTLGGS